jgi:hypothetical protein
LTIELMCQDFAQEGGVVLETASYSSMTIIQSNVETL